MKIKQIEWYYRVMDSVLTPFMYIVGGFKKDSLQHHHWYHVQKYKDSLDLSKCIQTVGTDLSKYINSGGVFIHKALFHMPIIGGWKNYVVLKNMDFDNDRWYIGWKTEQFCEISRLGTKNKCVKVLTGRKGDKTCFFGFNKGGYQIKLNKVGEGVLGDMKFVKAPLY